jgi:hypothetical protein
MGLILLDRGGVKHMLVWRQAVFEDSERLTPRDRERMARQSRHQNGGD